MKLRTTKTHHMQAIKEKRGPFRACCKHQDHTLYYYRKSCWCCRHGEAVVNEDDAERQHDYIKQQKDDDIQNLRYER